MSAYVVKRLVRMVVILWGSLTVIFILQRINGNPVALMLPDLATPQQQAQLKAELGLDKPIIVQYFEFIGRFSHGDFGNSFIQYRPVRDIVFQHLPWTLELAAAAVLLATIGGTIFGSLSAYLRRRTADKVVVAGTLLGQSVPTFWLGIIAILIFAVKLRWFPASGGGGINHLVLPAVTLAAYDLARTTRIARASMIEALSSDYVQTANAKGLRPTRVLALHALKNSSISILTVTAFMFSTLIGGALVTEVVFGWPGIGRLIVTSVLSDDYPVVQGAVFMIAIIVVVTYMLLDIAYTFIDPRLRNR